jgi:hypothetical protein
MATRLRGSHQAAHCFQCTKPNVSTIFFHHTDAIKDTHWKKFLKARGEVLFFFCFVRSGLDYLPCPSMRCLSPVACNKFTCTYSITAPGTGVGRVCKSHACNETTGALSENDDLFRIDERSGGRGTSPQAESE